MDIVEQLRQLAKEAAIRSIPKLLKTAASEGLKATKKQAEEALQERVPAQVLAPGPTQRASGRAYAENPESRYTIDLIDFSQNTSKPGYILVMMQTWSRRIWAVAMKDKTAQETNNGLKTLLDEAKPRDDLTHDMLHDAGHEFSQIQQVLGSNWVSRVKDPLDRNGIATLDRGIQSLKKNLEDIIEEEGGDWRTHLKQAVTAYNRSYHSAVLGPPSQAENGSVREFLIDQQNADAFAHNNALTNRRIASVQKTNYFREATGAKRSFNQAYGPKLHLESVIPGGQYIEGSDGKQHLLKRIIPVAENSGEPKGKLTQPRQYLADTLRDLAEEIHAELQGHPQSIKDLANTLDPKLAEREAKIKTKAFIERFHDLFKIENDKVYALVLSHPKKSRSGKEMKVEPVTTKEEPARPAHVDLPVSAAAAGGSQAALHFRGLLNYQPKFTPEQRREKLSAAEAAKALREAAKRERIDKSAKKEHEKQLKQLEKMMKKG